MTRHEVFRESEELISARLAEHLWNQRHLRGMTQAKLARIAQIPRSTLAHLERGKGNPTLYHLIRLAGALRIPIEGLIARRNESVKARFRHQNAQRIDESGCTESSSGPKRIDLLPEPIAGTKYEEWTFAPGSAHLDLPHGPHIKEIFLCLEGEVELVFEGERMELLPGEAAQFGGNCRHFYRNSGKATARGLHLLITVPASSSIY